MQNKKQKSKIVKFVPLLRDPSGFDLQKNPRWKISPHWPLDFYIIYVVYSCSISRVEMSMFEFFFFSHNMESKGAKTSSFWSTKLENWCHLVQLIEKQSCQTFRRVFRSKIFDRLILFKFLNKMSNIRHSLSFYCSSKICKLSSSLKKMSLFFVFSFFIENERRSKVLSDFRLISLTSLIKRHCQKSLRQIPS